LLVELPAAADVAATGVVVSELHAAGWTDLLRTPIVMPRFLVEAVEPTNGTGRHHDSLVHMQADRQFGATS
jgi:hypothetical protein